jgi:PQQ-dependent dehydrogenase (s-GDH family)
LFASIGALRPVSAQFGPETVVRGTKTFQRKVVVSGLANPWEVTWGPDGMLWVTERSGKRIVRVDPASGEKRVAITIPEVSAPGGQDGLLGMALHPGLLKGQDFIYAAYTYVDKARGAHAKVSDPASPYRFLYMKVVRLSYDQAAGTLSKPLDLITGLPAGNDHNAGRLKYGPDGKLYLTIGDQGHNQFGNYCFPIESQRLPVQAEVDAKNYSAYVGKTLRLNPDGSIPEDNPRLNGVVSHVFTYGHRNPQGIDFSPDGLLYSSEHGPKTDDEVNLLQSGGNYGWPHVAGKKDDQAYVYARWFESKTPCAQVPFNDMALPRSVPVERESEFSKPLIEPIATLFTVPNGFNFQDPACKGVDFICWPTVGASGVEHYQSNGTGIPDWDRVLLVTALKRGSLYVVPLDRTGKVAKANRIARYFHSENRYRDSAVSPDRKTIYIATDAGGVAEGLNGGLARRMQNPGAILAFTYAGEGTGKDAVEPLETTQRPPEPVEVQPKAPLSGPPPRFTAAQAAAGRKAYDASCAVCHGSTMTNGTMATPLAGDYFRKMWAGRTVRAFYDRAYKTMPPAAPASLPQSRYAEIVAYILEKNGYAAGAVPLRAGGGELDGMVLK